MRKYGFLLSHIGKNMGKLMFSDNFIFHFQMFLYIYIHIHEIQGYRGVFSLFSLVPFICHSNSAKTRLLSWFSFCTNPGQGMLPYVAHCKLHCESCFCSLIIHFFGTLTVQQVKNVISNHLEGLENHTRQFQVLNPISLS